MKWSLFFDSNHLKNDSDWNDDSLDDFKRIYGWDKFV